MVIIEPGKMINYVYVDLFVPKATLVFSFLFFLSFFLSFDLLRKSDKLALKPLSGGMTLEKLWKEGNKPDQGLQAVWIVAEVL